MQLLQVYIFLIPLVVLVLTECMKVVVEWARGGVWHQKLFHPGGMPSTHSAFVTSLLIVVWRKLGIESTEFAIAFCFACFVWYDAMVTRRVLEEQSKLLNRIQHFKKFAEDVGHSALEVVAGILFGAMVTAVGIWFSDQALGCGVFHSLAWFFGMCSHSLL
ncbi:hypothetical protein COU76_05780 [Candidatus Peregrinibacteria bacterium CG10_big_fil_rev_8_21_14_0_10_49_10]|nr:MAG: hypothetical protein COU76_05780 [Candidatus Peregrinibacteria bacterium CG10_big_fil_rev_8_21_14_0_10_49_10]